MKTFGYIKRIRVRFLWYSLVLIVSFALLLGGVTAQAQGEFQPQAQAADLVYNEAQMVYLTNLERRGAGQPPLRWNWQLTQAARWFSWDSVENRASGFCGHTDTLGRGAWQRVRDFGYLGFGGAENVVCGFVSPELAIQLLTQSEGHRANMLDPRWREIGVGYYRRASDGRGYITQDFGEDSVYAPVVIENEAISTLSPQVRLFIYDRKESPDFYALSRATEMMVSNDPYFDGAVWEPFRSDKTWALEGGSGWREVYVRTRDIFGRTLTVSDSIYLGENLPLQELGEAQMSTTRSQIVFWDLDETWPQVQFSLGWLADDTHPNFELNWGAGQRISDGKALGGSAFRLDTTSSGESYAWVWTTSFYKDVPLMAYFRLKVNDNSSPSEVGRIEVSGGGTTYGPLILRGSDFTAAGEYQEFPLAFTYQNNSNDPYLIFKFRRTGNTPLFVDAVLIFTAPQPVSTPLTWNVPGGNYRGQGVWVRYTNGQGFSSVQTRDPTPPLQISPEKLMAFVRSGEAVAPMSLSVRISCACVDWQATSDVDWLQLQRSGDTLLVTVDSNRLAFGLNTATITIRPTSPDVPPRQVPVQVLFGEGWLYLPLLTR